MADEIWAITAHFNPMHWQRRIANYRVFRRHLPIPLVAVEVAYDGRFDLTSNDADVLLQYPSHAILWQRERMLNLALKAVPPEVQKVVWIDADVILERPDVWAETCRALDQAPLVQPFSHVYHLPAGHSLDFAEMDRSLPAAAGFAWLRKQGKSTLELCSPVWTNAGPAATFPPVTYGLACAFRRAVFAEYGFYDPWVVGGGAKLVCFAADGHWREGADSMRFHGAVREHFRRWVEGFHSVVRGEWGCIRGGIAHLWHGNPGNRKYRARHDEFERFQFDPSTDLALDENGLWRWNSDKPDMHQYVRDYFAGRQEDG